MKWPLVWRSTYEAMRSDRDMLLRQMEEDAPQIRAMGKEISRLRSRLRNLTPDRDPSGRFIKRGEG